MRVVNVPIAEAVLFIPPDGVDRDPDLSSEVDRAALSKIRAQPYIQARDGRDKPEWIKGAHRLYCPCCLDKGHLSRHKGVRSFDRPHINFQGEEEVMHHPASFTKRHDGLDHLDDCDFAHRHERFDPRSRISSAEIAERRAELDQRLHTISIPTAAVITMPPRRIVSYSHDAAEFGPEDNGQVSKRSAIIKPPPLRTINELAAFIIAHKHDQVQWDEKLLHTADGPQSLHDIFLNSNRGVMTYCQTRQQLGQGMGTVVASLLPNRIPRFWEGYDMPSHPSTTPVVMFSAQNEESYEHLKDLFSPKGQGSGDKILAYGLAGMRSDGRPEIRIFRPEQVTSWQEPNPQADLF